MNNIIDYLEWRGDIEFDYDGISEVDNLIFSMIAYLNFDMLRGTYRIEDAAKAYFAAKKRGTSRQTRGFIRKIENLLDKLSKVDRYKDILVSDYIYKYDHDNESQFSAMAFTYGSWTYVAYRGTDDSLIGFKEDFNMCFSAPVAAQKEAVTYLKKILDKYPRQDIYIGGHSKGGNLAVYSLVGLGHGYMDRVVQIYNNDGPGFTEKILKMPSYKEVAKKVKKLLPSNSLVGVLMNDEEGYSIVKARGDSGIVQHDGFNWYVKTREFVKVDSFSDESLHINKTLELWLASFNMEERNKFIDEFYSLIIKSTDASVLGDISGKEIHSIISMVKNIRSLDEDSKDILLSGIKKLIKSNSKAKNKVSLGNKIRKTAENIMQGK